METVSRGSLIDWSEATENLPGQQESGDRSLVAPYAGGVLVGVVDGLGHGADAARCAEIAVSCFKEHPEEPLPEMIRRCHGRLRSMRGIAVTLASFDFAASTMTWLAIGNVAGVRLPAPSDAQQHSSRLVLRGGVVGDKLPSLGPTTLGVSEGDTLMLATDGIAAGFADTIRLVSSPEVMAKQIIENHATGRDDALIMVVRYLGAERHGSMR